MNKAQEAGREFRAMDELSQHSSPIHRLSPLAKLLVTVFYICVTVSFHKYDIRGLLFMVLFLIAGYQFGFLSVGHAFRKMRYVMPLVCLIGLFNPFFDRQILFRLGSLNITGGMVSLVTLAVKGVFTLLAVYFLVATTSMEEICLALRRLHVPKLLVSLFLLTYRYIGLLTEEVAIMTDAYHLRAPRQKGIHISAWGSFLGQLILRSMDLAQNLYDSMLLRGYNGEFYYINKQTGKKASIVFALIAIGLIILVRLHGLFELWIG